MSGICPVSREGLVSVQDLGAQCAAFPLALEPGLKVLDACAAPGGKTALMAEREPGLAKLTAVDIDSARLTRVRENLERGGLEAEVLSGDAALPAAWWDGAPFDRILLDAPCSALGVIRRHPDIRLRRSPKDIDKMPPLQGRLLAAAWADARARRPPGVLHMHGDPQRESRSDRGVPRGDARRTRRPGPRLAGVAGFRGGG